MDGRPSTGVGELLSNSSMCRSVKWAWGAGAGAPQLGAYAMSRLAWVRAQSTRAHIAYTPSMSPSNLVWLCISISPAHSHTRRRAVAHIHRATVQRAASVFSHSTPSASLSNFNSGSGIARSVGVILKEREVFGGSVRGGVSLVKIRC
ncbi:hypothetical protein H2248_002347 [Termitomyces sp. 'cryptogamus']|nr:hypothetical protein H2248_002347 [Termitomyces sp. 'cryptogamus']